MNSTKKKRLLVVDDDEHLLTTLTDYLSFELRGFDIVPAKSGEEALGLIAEGEPDLVILDIAMPGMGGTGFLRAIAGPDGKPRYPVLVLTARASLEDFFTELDIDGFLSKPCGASELMGKIREVLDRRNPSPQVNGRARRLILLAENDEQSIRSLRRAFERSGHDLCVVDNGADVVTSALAELPDAIVLKAVLPRLNGDAVAVQLGASPQLRRVPIIMYDETRTPSENRRYGYRNTSRVRRFLMTDSPRAIVEAVQEALRVNQ